MSADHHAVLRELGGATAPLVRAARLSAANNPPPEGGHG